MSDTVKGNLMRSGITLIELLIVLAIVVIVIALVGSAAGLFGSSTFQATITDKWTDLDYEGNRVYRVRTVKDNGEVDTWNSYWVHDNVQVGVSYQFKASGGYLREANRLALQPVRVEAGQ